MKISENFRTPFRWFLFYTGNPETLKRYESTAFVTQSHLAKKRTVASFAESQRGWVIKVIQGIRSFSSSDWPRIMIFSQTKSTAEMTIFPNQKSHTTRTPAHPNVTTLAGCKHVLTHSEIDFPPAACAGNGTLYAALVTPGHSHPRCKINPW